MPRFASHHGRRRPARPPAHPPQWGFTVYFVAAVDPATIPGTPEEQWSYCMRTPGCIELTHNHGSEKEEGKLYNTGNSDPTGTTDGEKVRGGFGHLGVTLTPTLTQTQTLTQVRGGFGHLGVTVPDVYEACARFASLGCAPMSRAQDLYGRPAWPQAADWLRLAEARGRPGARSGAEREASGEPSGRRPSHLGFDPGASSPRRRTRGA